MQSYYAADLCEDNSVEVIPAVWLFDNNTKCNWPWEIKDRAKLTSLVQKCKDPSENPRISWKTFNCRCLYGTDDYNKARKFADRASNSDEVELTENEALPTGQRILRNNKSKTKYIIPPLPQSGTTVDAEPNINPLLGNSGDHGNNGELNIFQCESNGGIPVGDNLQENVLNVPEGDDNGLDQGAPDYFVESTSKLDNLLAEFQNFYQEFQSFEKVTLDKLVKLTKEVEHISRQVARNSSSHDEAGLDLPPGFSFPMQACKDSTILNNWLMNGENQEKLITYLKGIGGSDHKDCVRRILDRIFSGDLAVQVNYSGAHGKIAFKNHRLYKCVIGSLRSDSNVKPTEVEINHWIQKWFGGAGDRNGGRAARSKKNSNDCTEHSSSDDDIQE